MDPAENLRQQRALAQRIVNTEDPSMRAVLGDELAGLVLALDEWLENGGFNPYAPDAPA